MCISLFLKRFNILWYNLFRIQRSSFFVFSLYRIRDYHILLCCTWSLLTMIQRRFACEMTFTMGDILGRAVPTVWDIVLIAKALLRVDPIAPPTGVILLAFAAVLSVIGFLTGCFNDCLGTAGSCCCCCCCCRSCSACLCCRSRVAWDGLINWGSFDLATFVWTGFCCNTATGGCFFGCGGTSCEVTLVGFATIGTIAWAGRVWWGEIMVEAGLRAA